MADQQLLVNGNLVSGGDISIDLGYGSVVGAQEISWEEKQEHTLRYGKGFLPVGSTKGKYEASGKLKIVKDEFDSNFLTWIESNSNNGTPMGMPPFDITVTYDVDGGGSSTTRLMGCLFNSLSETSTMGGEGTDLSVELDFICMKPIERDTV